MLVSTVIADNNRMQAATQQSSSFHGAATDASGASIFCSGDIGIAHVRAHDFLDRRDSRAGAQWLGRYLAFGPHGTPSHWVHLHWHMFVFELDLGRVQDARRRFADEIFPWVEPGRCATDGPSALWRLRLAGAEPEPHFWRAASVAAATRARTTTDSFVELHDLLAWAGAAELDLLDAWIDQALPEDFESIKRRQPMVVGERRGHDASPRATLLAVAKGLRHFVVGNFVDAESMLRRSCVGLGELGGSRAQNQLLEAITADASRRAEGELEAVSKPRQRYLQTPLVLGPGTA